MKITVYLGANEGNDPSLKEAVKELGVWIGENGHTLVYGGSKSSKERQQGIYFAESLSEIGELVKE